VGVEPMLGYFAAGRIVCSDAHVAASAPIVARAIVLGVTLSLIAAQALGQEAPVPGAQPPATTTPDPSNPGDKPGFIDAFGRFVGDSAAKLNSQLKGANETLSTIGSQTTDAAKGAVSAAKDAMDTARDTASTMIGLPSTRVVTGHETCAMAPNGAPDCRAAADTACRNKGFASGRSVDTQTAQKCPPHVWLSGRPPAEGECPVETWLTRAICQ
jgi:hypothetical protein